MQSSIIGLKKISQAAKILILIDFFFRLYQKKNIYIKNYKLFAEERNLNKLLLFISSYSIIQWISQFSFYLRSKICFISVRVCVIFSDLKTY